MLTSDLQHFEMIILSRSVFYFHVYKIVYYIIVIYNDINIKRKI